MTITPFVAPMALVIQDTAGKVPYVPRAGGPPDTSSYMWAGYVITALLYGGYIVLLARRMSRARRGDRSAS